MFIDDGIAFLQFFMTIVNNTNGAIGCSKMNLVSKFSLALNSFLVHALQHRNMDVHIAVDTNLLLAFIILMEASSVLCQTNLP